MSECVANPVQESVLIVDPQDVWPPDVMFLLSVLDGNPSPAAERRIVPRARYRARARLALSGDRAGHPPHELFSRDVTFRSMGFVSEHPVPGDGQGVLHLMMPNNRVRTLACTVLRCREAAPGLYEGAVLFKREHPEFSIESLIVCGSEVGGEDDPE